MTSSIFLLTDSTDIKWLSQDAVKISKCLFSMLVLILSWLVAGCHPRKTPAEELHWAQDSPGPAQGSPTHHPEPPDEEGTPDWWYSSWQVRSWDMSYIFPNDLIKQKSPTATLTSILHSQCCKGFLFKTNLYFLGSLRNFNYAPFTTVFTDLLSKLLVFSWILFYSRVLCFLCIPLHNLKWLLKCSFIHWVMFVLPTAFTKENLPVSFSNEQTIDLSQTSVLPNLISHSLIYTNHEYRVHFTQNLISKVLQIVTWQESVAWQL